jgi:hypothetical protein
MVVEVGMCIVIVLAVVGQVTMVDGMMVEVKIVECCEVRENQQGHMIISDFEMTYKKFRSHWHLVLLVVPISSRRRVHNLDTPKRRFKVFFLSFFIFL